MKLARVAVERATERRPGDRESLKVSNRTILRPNVAVTLQRNTLCLSSRLLEEAKVSMYTAHARESSHHL